MGYGVKKVPYYLNFFDVRETCGSAAGETRARPTKEDAAAARDASGTRRRSVADAAHADAGAGFQRAPSPRSPRRAAADKKWRALARDRCAEARAVARVRALARSLSALGGAGPQRRHAAPVGGTRKRARHPRKE